MIDIVVGWVRNLFNDPVEVIDQISVPISPSQQGHRFQRAQFEKLFNGIGDWPSIEFLDAYGDPITCLDDISEGPDGGIDAIINITTKTEKGAKIVATRIRNMIVNRDY